ncbi:hypothetical protein LTS18_012135, partial [Coniosporium uncinatum]
HVSSISSSHASTICRAVASAITAIHLARFQKKILTVESSILKKDAKSVGAYNIVPLAAVVGEFDEWNRLMDWLWDVACFMVSNNEEGRSHARTGAALVDKLRRESQTGYPDIETAALELGKVAETAWLRQLSSWVLYGRVPSSGAEDFFVQKYDVDDKSDESYFTNSTLLPKFVSSGSAASILFIGKSLNHIKTKGLYSDTASRNIANPELELLQTHLQYLSELQFPLSSTGLSGAVAAIRLSLSKNMLRQLLPLPKILEMLNLLQDFFLLGRGEFAVSLITEADERMRARNRRTSHGSSRRAQENLGGLLLKEAEVNSVLAKAWTTLSSYVNDEDPVDESLELARDILQLTIAAKSVSTRPGTPGRAKDGGNDLPQLSNVSFNDLLLPVPTRLTLDIPSPLDLFLSASEMNLYSSISSYLLSLRRAHLHISDLWRQTLLRRDHPTPLGPPQSTTAGGRKLLKQRRQRAFARRMEMRKVWATCSSAIFLLSETGEYFEGQVVKESWQHLRSWITGSKRHRQDVSRPASAASAADGTADLRASTSSSFARSTRSQSSETEEQAPRDPEALATAHRRFLTSVTHLLLLTDSQYSHFLRDFLLHIDELVAYLLRLQSIQQSLDLEEDEGIIDAMSNNVQDEKDVKLELDRSRKRVDSDMKALVQRLRELDKERIGVEGLKLSTVGDDGYEPWRGAGIDRLLMKLEFGRVMAEEEEMEGF